MYGLWSLFAFTMFLLVGRDDPANYPGSFTALIFIAFFSLWLLIKILRHPKNFVTTCIERYHALKKYLVG